MACSAGFYVRSLAHDLGQALGMGATLEALRRTRAGAFGLEDAVDASTTWRTSGSGRPLAAGWFRLRALLPDAARASR